MYQDLKDARYSSIADFVSAMAQGPRNPINRTLWRNWGYDDVRDSWYGADCRTGMDVQRKMHDGWQEGRERMNALRSQLTMIEAAPIDRRRKMVRADAGDVLDMTYVYAGQLDAAWKRPRRLSSQGPQKIEIVANMICSGGEHADILFWRGAAAVTLADLLEQAGYMVRLVVAFGGAVFNNEQVSCRITVKEHGAPLDITSTSATIMPGFFRALGHAWIAAHCVGTMSPGGISVKQSAIEPGELIVSHGVRDHGTSLAYVNDVIAKLNEGRALAA
jgi:hypothetical protein